MKGMKNRRKKEMITGVRQENGKSRKEGRKQGGRKNR
jgi:hypothetical protein